VYGLNVPSSVALFVLMNWTVPVTRTVYCRVPVTTRVYYPSAWLGPCVVRTCPCNLGCVVSGCLNCVSSQTYLHNVGNIVGLWTYVHNMFVIFQVLPGTRTSFVTSVTSLDFITVPVVSEGVDITCDAKITGGVALTCACIKNVALRCSSRTSFCPFSMIVCKNMRT
jgi:hypothetical protein